jgi:hypothetical protein
MDNPIIIMDFNNMATATPVTETITRRFSCRTYIDKPIQDKERTLLEGFITENKTGPFNTTPRFQLIAAKTEDHKALT